MKKFCSFSIVYLFAISLVSCLNLGETITGNGISSNENRSINRASKIKLKGPMDVIISEGETSVRVEADENLLPYIITELRDNWLEIKLENNISIKSQNDVKIYITTPSLTNISVAGSGDVTATGDFDSGKKAAYSIAGSGDITMVVNAPRVEADIAGSGNLKLTGMTRDLDVKIAGSGNFEGNDLKAENAKVKIAGSGDVFLFADVNLDAKVVGSGSVKYRGNATVNRKVVGSGSISKMP